ncbi:MAG: ATP-binding cassette domain-containing protein, partial [Burkholderia sp.]|nr:ATP-binding cassette domain-containing protein [Burkholderia sp.]
MANLFDVPQFIQDAPSRAAEPVSNAAPTQAAVVFDNVGKVFAGTRGASTAALADVTLNVARGEVFGIIGRSGAGKSTLLRLVNGLEKPSSGAVRVNGVSVGELDERGLVTLRRRIGMVF